MSLNAQGYFNTLRSYLNRAHYEAMLPANGKLLMKEEIFLPGNQKSEIRVPLNFQGDVIVINLDKKKSQTSNHSEPLFHFLDDTGQPWSKRCDFVVFHLCRGRIDVHCFEFKWETLPVEKVIDQLAASEAWCRVLHNIIKTYTSKRRRINLKKYVLSAHPDPSPYIDENHYLRRDSSIRHFHYDNIRDTNLEDLVNDHVLTIN